MTQQATIRRTGRRFASQFSSAFSPKQIFLSLIAALVNGIIAINFTIAYAALIFNGELSYYLSAGISLALFSAVVIGVVSALTSSLPGILSGPRSSPAAILGISAVAIASSLSDSVSSDELFLTILATIVLTSLAMGTFFFVLGQLKLGNLIRFLPYPVIGGFLSGIGLFLVKGSIGILTGVSFSFSQLSYFFQPDQLGKWLSGFVFAMILLFATRRYKHFLIMPGILVAAIASFYVILWLTNTSLAEASVRGWLLGPFPKGGKWSPLTVDVIIHADWKLIFSLAGSGAAILALCAIDVLLQVTGIELAVEQDMDLNRELKVAGVANLLSALGGGMPGYPATSITVLAHKMGTRSRLVGLFVAASCGVVLIFGSTALSYFPKLIVGGLNMYVGMSFLTKWVYDSWFKFPKADYAIIILILVTVGTVGFLEGVGMGLIATIILFVVNYSQGNAVRHSLSAATYQSNVERPRLYHQLIQKKGHWLHILELQGFVFFGLSNKLLEEVRRRINAPKLTARYVLIDFRLVTGLDTSAALSFTRIKQLAKVNGVMLIFTNLSPQIRKQLDTEVLNNGENTLWRIFPDLDHGVEWCEDQMIQTFESVGFAAKPKTLVEELEKSLPPSVPSSQLMKYFDQKDVEDGYTLIQQGDAPKGLHFIEKGQVTVWLKTASGETIRIRTAGEGTLIGELGMYLDAPATASVTTDEPSVIYGLSTDTLQEMEEKDPDVATAFHRFIAQLLAERLVDNTRTIETLQR